MMARMACVARSGRLRLSMSAALVVCLLFLKPLLVDLLVVLAYGVYAEMNTSAAFFIFLSEKIAIIRCV